MENETELKIKSLQQEISSLKGKVTELLSSKYEKCQELAKLVNDDYYKECDNYFIAYAADFEYPHEKETALKFFRVGWCAARGISYIELEDENA